MSAQMWQAQVGLGSFYMTYFKEGYIFLFFFILSQKRRIRFWWQRKDIQAADFQAKLSKHHFPHANPICTLQPTMKGPPPHKTTIQVFSQSLKFRSLV